MRGINATATALRSAFKQGNFSAAFILGRLYQEGWGLKQDARAAFRWFKRAAHGRMPEAYYYLAFAYHTGAGVARDLAQAFRWFRLSAKAGDLTGLYMQGQCLLDGMGTTANVRAGVQLLRKAADRGSNDAMEYLAVHYMRRGRLKRARIWAQRSWRAGNEVAPLWLKEIDRLEKESRGRLGRRRNTAISTREPAQRRRRRPTGTTNRRNA